MAGSSSDGFDYVPFPNQQAAPPAAGSQDGFTYVPFANTSVAPAPPTDSSDGFAYVPFTTQAAQTTAPAEPTANDTGDPNEGVIGKAWDWLNKPLLNLRRQNAGGVEAGVEDVASGMTSPLSIGLTIATAGAGGLLESLGLDLTKMAAPEVISAARTAGKLAAAGFTAQQLYGIAQESPYFVKAVKDGDTQKALEIGTSSLLQGGMALFGAKHAIGDLLGTPESMQANTKDSLIGRYQRFLKEDTQVAKKFNNEFKDAVKSAPQREAIHFYAQAGGDMGKLSDWQKQVEDASDLNPQLQRQVVDDLKRAQLMNEQSTPKEMEWAHLLRQFYAGNFDRAVTAGVLDPESRIENFVAHPRWQQDNVETQNVADAQNALQGSGKDNHTKQRVFGSTVEGILARKDGKLLGFTPGKSGGRYQLDAADLASDYRLSIGKEIAKKDFIDTLLRTRMADNRPGAVPSGMASEFEAKPVLDDEGNEIEPASTKTIINGDIIPDRPLSKRDVAYLRKQGLFQAMIDNGLIKDQGDRVVETAPAQSAEPATPSVEAAEAEKVQDEAKPAEFQGDDGRTYVESEHQPGEELPITPKPEEDVQAKLQKLPEHIYGAVKALESQAQELKDNPTAEDAEQLKEDLLNNRYELEDMFEGQRFPKGVRKAALDYIRQLSPTEDEELESKYYRGRYRYDTHDYDNSIRHPYARKSVYGGAEDQFLNTPLAIHPEMLKTAKSILTPEKSWLERNPVTKRVMDMSAAAKHTLLSLSGFHWVQEGLKGLESGLGPKAIFSPEGWDMNNVRHLKLIEAGGIQPGIQGGANSFAEGLRGDGLISHVPGVGPLMDSVNDKLFGPDGYIDRLKLQAALKFDDRLRQMYPKLDDTTRLKVAGQMANNRFGGQNYLALGRSPMARDIMRLAVLAPDWFESQARDAGMLVGPFAKMRAVDLARIALYNFVAAQTLNKLNTGSFHLDTPFGVQSQDGKKVYTVRTLPSDLFHAATNFRDYLSNRMNPVVTRTAVEALTGRDKQGKLRDMGEQVKDLFSNVIPIPAHSAFDVLTGNAMPNESVSDSVRSALGMTTKTNPTPAESLAYKLASENQATGHVPSEQVAKFHSILNLENRLRDGDQSAIQDLQTQYREGKLARADVQSILKGAKSTRLGSIVNRLPMSNALDVWNLTTNEERQRLAPVMLKKMVNFQKTERQKLTPAEQSRIDTRLAQAMNELQQARNEQ